MKTKQIIQEYLKCKIRIQALDQDLKSLARASEFVKVTKYGEESTGEHLSTEEVLIKLLDKRRDLEMKIEIDKVFIAKVDYALAILEQDLVKHEYEIFYLRYLKKRTLEYLAIKYGYAHASSIYRKLKKYEKQFEEMINIHGEPHFF